MALSTTNLNNGSSFPSSCKSQSSAPPTERSDSIFSFDELESTLHETNEETLSGAIDDAIMELMDEELYLAVIKFGKKLKIGCLRELGLLEDSSSSEYQAVDTSGLDIFGQPLTKKLNYECECPKCNRTLAAARFAPHLEKCMGMGRNSSRIASLKNRRLATANNTTSGMIAASAARDPNIFCHITSSNSSDGSNDSSPVKNGVDPLSDDDHFDEDEDDEEWTIEKKKKTKKSNEKVTPKKKGPLSRVKNSEFRRNKRGVSPTVSVASSSASTTMDVANYDELTNDSFPS